MGIQGENEREVDTPGKREGSEVFHGVKGLVNAPCLNPGGGTGPVMAQRDSQPLIPRDVKLVEEGPQKSGYSDVWLVTPVCPMAEYVKPTTWSVKPHGPLFRTEVEVCCGNMREIVEVFGRFWEVRWNGRHSATEGKLQT